MKKQTQHSFTHPCKGSCPLLLSFFLLFFSLTACKDDEGGGTTPVPPNPEPEMMNLAMLAESRTELSSFLAAVEQAGLTSTLENENSDLTVFAPTNQAFAALLAELGVELADVSQDQLQDILQYHIVEGSRLSGSLSNGELTSLNDGTIDVAVDGGVTLNGSASVVTADLEASNGVIHIIDEVLMEETPEDPSIAAFLGQEEDLSILAEIVNLPQFSEVIAAAENPESTLTVFAPTNTYFEQLLEQLGKNSVEELPENVLTEIITYHIIGEALSSSELESGSYATLQGEEVTVSTVDGVTVNGISVGEADIMASNGYIHKIEGVLLPIKNIPATYN